MNTSKKTLIATLTLLTVWSTGLQAYSTTTVTTTTTTHHDEQMIIVTSADAQMAQVMGITLIVGAAISMAHYNNYHKRYYHRFGHYHRSHAMPHKYKNRRVKTQRNRPRIQR